jgi:type II secretory pathway component PulK
MSRMPYMLLLSALSLAKPVFAQTEKPTCLDSSRVRNWVVMNDETLLLDLGRKKYRLHLQQACFNLSSSPTLQFNGDPVSGRVCGSLLDAIQVQGEQCRISKIEEIDKQIFNDAQNKKKVSLKLKQT